MNEYYYYVDEKVSLWCRTYFKIIAESKEEANEKAKNLYIEEGIFSNDIDVIDSDYLEHTEEPLDVEMNNGQATIELYSEYGTLLYKNRE